MARFHYLPGALARTLSLLLLLFSTSLQFCNTLDSTDSNLDDESSLLSFHHHDYSPPVPPPPPPHPPSVLSCVDDLGGVGSLNTTCKIVDNLNFTDDVYITGAGNFVVLEGISIIGFTISVDIIGNFSLGENSSVVASTFELVAGNASFANGSVVNTTGLAGDPPSQTSGTPFEGGGAGGGYGGRGAGCLVDKDKDPEDVWGGDAYSWASLDEPWSYGSKGGSTSKEEDYGGGGGGRVKLDVGMYLEINGSVLADGGDGGTKGGGGSGGSIQIKGYKM